MTYFSANAEVSWASTWSSYGVSVNDSLAPSDTTIRPFTKREQMTSDHHSHHEIDYIEFEVTDMAQSQRFYETAFDWKFSDYGPGYAGIQKRDAGEAGGLRLAAEVAIGPLVILYSSDLDRSLAAVRAAGGEITQEPYEFPGGRRFHFKDPSGNHLAVWSET